MIFAMGGGIFVFEGISRIRHPEPMKSPVWNYLVLAASFVFEGASDRWIGIDSDECRIWYFARSQA